MISIDRLARSTFDLFAIVKRIVDARGQFRSLAEPWADTATGIGRLMIAVLGGLADVERDLIRTRTAEAVAWCACAMIPCLHRAVGCTSVFRRHHRHRVGLFAKGARHGRSFVCGKVGRTVADQVGPTVLIGLALRDYLRGGDEE